MSPRALRAAFILTVAACGASTISNPTNDGDGPIAAGPPDGPATDARVTCSSAIDCPVGNVCNPATSKCVASLACVHHSDCGKQAYCQTNGTCAVNMLYGLCDTSDNCVGDETCVSGHCGCGGQPLTATVVAPNMLIALDRSQSMDTMVGQTGKSRWTIAEEAIKALTAKYQAGLRFGLVLWPGQSKTCTQNETHCRGVNQAVGIDFNTGTTIASYLDTAGRCSLGTPIGNTLTVLDSYAGLDDTTRANYVVLVTDGGENCGNDSDGPNAATTLFNHTPQVKTFAVGFSSDANPTVLTAIAQNGGTARSGTPAYYQADNQDQLAAAFDAIAASIVSCDYTLSTEPSDPARLFVFLGTTVVTRDTTHKTGWDYDATTKHLTFYGATCDQIRTGGQNLSVVFGCTVIP